MEDLAAVVLYPSRPAAGFSFQRHLAAGTLRPDDNFSPTTDHAVSAGRFEALALHLPSART
jgi:hypothetical protein